MTLNPDFFIFGAPKCGTTALSHYLSDHPDVVMSKPKEPCYWSKDICKSPNHNVKFKDAQHYESIFRITGAQKVAGEASTDYFFSSCASKCISRLYPKSRIVTMIRPPGELAYSLYMQKRKEGVEPIEDPFVAYRVSGYRGKQPNEKVHYLNYKWACRVGTHLARIIGDFGRDRVLLCTHRDFCRDPGEVYEEVLGHLGLESDGRLDFPSINRTGVPVNLTWAKILGRLPRMMGPAYDILKMLIPRRVHGIRGVREVLSEKALVTQGEDQFKSKFISMVNEEMFMEIELAKSFLKGGQVLMDESQ